MCVAGSRVFVQEGIYDKFVALFVEAAKAFGTTAGDPFAPTTQHGPQVSQIQYDVCPFLGETTSEIS
jgi:aldehyde dehydrogenase (NAD+)